MNYVSTATLERILAIKQIAHYLYVQQSALDADDVSEFHRASKMIECLTLEYGDGALFEAEDELL
jgi:hypothetical protein